MMKKILCILLGMLILTGCTAPGPTEPTMENTAASTEPIDYWQEVKAATPAVPEYDGNLLIEYDPDREVYISLSNADTDLYPNDYITIPISIITKEHFDPDDIQIHVPIQTEYELRIEDFSDHYAIDSNQTSSKLKYYQYLCLQDVDWQEFAQQYEYGLTANHLGAYCENMDDRAAYWAIRDKCWSVYDAKQAEYEALVVGDVPVFYVYRIHIEFINTTEFYDEAFETIDITLGEKTYTQNIGQIRLHKEMPQEIQTAHMFDAHEGIKIDSVTFGVISDNAYNDGYAGLHDIIEFKATEDLTITGLRQIGTQLNIYACRVRISGKPDFYWDMERPLEIENGDDVIIDLYLKDDRFKQYEALLCNYLVMDYQIRNMTYSLPRSCSNDRFNNIWDTYLMAFIGYDIGAYYKCYWNRQNTSWIDSLTEKLR